MIKKIVFIVGVGRSGTNLLQGMMNAHENITFPPETQFIRHFITNPSINNKIRKGDNGRVRRKILEDKNLNELNINLKDIIEGSTEGSKLSLIDFYEKLLEAYLIKKKKKIIGDKYPKNIEYLKEIKALFPGAYIVHIIRDPRDVVLSRLKADWSKGRPVFVQALTCREQIKMGRKDGRNLFGENYYELLYENLLENPETELSKVCRFLGIDFDENMLEFNQRAGEIVKNKEKKWKDNLFKPILSSNKNKWMSELKKSQIFQVETICQPIIEDFGYIKSDNKARFYCVPKVFLRALAELSDIVYKVYHTIRYARTKKYLRVV